MDELDVKILRALFSERAVAPSGPQLSSSLRSIASRLGADDATVNYRYKKLEESGAMSGWQLLVNPTFFGHAMMDVTVDVEPESGKQDMIRKLKLIQEVAAIYDFYGRALKVLVTYNGEESRSRVIELISRITNAESMTQVRWALPRSRTERLTESDLAIIRALIHDARKNSSQVAKELGFSSRTVSTRVGRLRIENTIFALPILNLGGIPGFLPVFLSFSYSKTEEKGAVDRAMLSHFEASYLSAEFSDPNRGWIILSASTTVDVKQFLEWGRSLPGVGSARIDILTESMMFPEKRIELIESNKERVAIQRKGLR
jgi:DNA-binding Lrp family transcriptional regulator